MLLESYLESLDFCLLYRTSNINIYVKNTQQDYAPAARTVISVLTVPAVLPNFTTAYIDKDVVCITCVLVISCKFSLLIFPKIILICDMGI